MLCCDEHICSSNPTRSSISFHTWGIMQSACNQGVTSTTSGRTCRVAHEEMKMSQRASMTDESPTSSLPRKITPCFVALTSSLTFRSRPPLSSSSWRTRNGRTDTESRLGTAEKVPSSSSSNTYQDGYGTDRTKSPGGKSKIPSVASLSSADRQATENPTGMNMRKRGARELRPPSAPEPARASREVCPLAVKIRAAWRAGGRSVCASIFCGGHDLAARLAAIAVPCPPPSFKTSKNVASSRFRRDATFSLALFLAPSLRGPLPTQMPRWKSLLFLSAILFRSSRFSFKILSQKIPSTAASAAIRGLVCRSLATCIPSPFRESRCFDRLKIGISEGGCRSEFLI